MTFRQALFETAGYALALMLAAAAGAALARAGW